MHSLSLSRRKRPSNPLGGDGTGRDGTRRKEEGLVLGDEGGVSCAIYSCLSEFQLRALAHQFGFVLRVSRSYPALCISMWNGAEEQVDQVELFSLIHGS
ncbi:hypothetical protein NL676_027766 [Syzygium grande]|nr:hypothetical protein NL676_027766 [Syzygium grande]